MFHTIYKVTNNTNGKYYIGRHKTYNPNDDYMGSGPLIRKAIKKYGKSNFQKEVLFVFDNEKECIEKEIELVNESVIHDEMCYNLCKGGKGGFDHINRLGLNAGDNSHMRNNPETRKKCIEAGKKTRSENPDFYKEVSIRNLAKATEKNTGAKRPPEVGKKIGDSLKAWHTKEGNRDKLRDSLNSTWEIESPTGEKYVTNRMTDFCESRGIPYVTLYMSYRRGEVVKKGKAKGWKCKKMN